MYMVYNKTFAETLKPNLHRVNDENSSIRSSLLLVITMTTKTTTIMSEKTQTA